MFLCKNESVYKTNLKNISKEMKSSENFTYYIEIRI